MDFTIEVYFRGTLVAKIGGSISPWLLFALFQLLFIFKVI